MSTENKIYAPEMVKTQRPKPKPDFAMATKEEDKSDKPAKKTARLKEGDKLFPTISSRLAQDSFHYAKQYWPGGRERFPENPHLQIIDKYYPYAKGGPLWVDEPFYDWQIAECRQKEPVLREKGFRYVLLLPQMTHDEALDQLGERCGQQPLQTYAS